MTSMSQSTFRKNKSLIQSNYEHEGKGLLQGKSRKEILKTIKWRVQVLSSILFAR